MGRMQIDKRLKSGLTLQDEADWWTEVNNIFVKCCNFLRKPSKKKNIRKRAILEEDEESKAQYSLLNNLKKAPKTDTKLSFKNNSTTAIDSNTFRFESSKEIQLHNDSNATATLQTETDISRDSRAIRERALKQAADALRGKKHSDDKIYKGIHAYTDHKAGFRREQTISSEKAGGSHGPLRASAHIRVSARFDYQPDICKDYKETGYCGYGDSCKFMHDRGDYKPGWQMEKEWDEAEKARKRKLAMGGGDDEDEVVAAQSGIMQRTRNASYATNLR
ncbi:hypothetical protein ACFE04_026689 [Oxalis oulophora]